MTYSKESARDGIPTSCGAHSPASAQPSSRKVVASTKRNLSASSMGKTHELMSRIRSILNDSLSQCNRLTAGTSHCSSISGWLRRFLEVTAVKLIAVTCSTESQRLNCAVKRKKLWAPLAPTQAELSSGNSRTHSAIAAFSVFIHFILFFAYFFFFCVCVSLQLLRPVLTASALLLMLWSSAINWCRVCVCVLLNNEWRRTDAIALAVFFFFLSLSLSLFCIGQLIAFFVFVRPFGCNWCENESEIGSTWGKKTSILSFSSFKTNWEVSINKL